MNKLPVAALAALALAATIPTSAQADDPVTPVQGAVCNLYQLPRQGTEKGFSETASSLAAAPAAATFVDSSTDFKANEKKAGISSVWGMWTGWFKQEKAGTFTFTCQQKVNTSAYGNHANRYAIEINGTKYANAIEGQFSFDANLIAGFNAIKVVVENADSPIAPLMITYKKKGSVKEPVSFGPENMFYDDED